MRNEDPPRPLVPDYEVIRQIGVGAYGEVWLARNVFGEYRAIKMVWRHSFGDDERPFQREFEGIKRFEPLSRSHPSQLAILHVGHNEQAGCFYYVMELPDGVENPKPETQNPKETRSANTEGASEFHEVRPSGFGLLSDFGLRDSDLYAPHTLRHDLKLHGRLSVDQVIELGLALTEALAHLHTNGLVHRDIKPSNIIFVKGKPKLADIGLVTNTGDERSIIGTEGYLAPEGPGKPPADIYSLGKVLYEAAMGRDRRDFPDLPENWQSLPELKQLLELNEVLLKACAGDPRERYQTAEEMASELGLLKRGRSVVSKRASAWRWKLAKNIAIGVTALAVLSIGGEMVFRKLNGKPVLSSNPEARRLYLRAMYESQGSTLESTLQAYNELTRALELDSKFVDAYYKIFELNWGAWSDQLPPHKDMMANLRWCRDKIGALSTNCPQYHMVSAGIKFLDWHFEDAIAEMEVSLNLDPNFRSDGFYGFMILRARGDAAAARREWRTAERVNGRPDLVTEVQLGTTDYFEGNLAKAIDQFRSAATYEPHCSLAHEWLSRAYEANRQYELAVDELETAEKLVNGDKPELSAKYARYRSALKNGGPRAMWQAMLADLKQSPAPDPSQMAKLYARLDQTEEAFLWLERARQEHAGEIASLLVDDWWDPLRGDPRFKKLLKIVGLPDVRPGRK